MPDAPKLTREGVIWAYRYLLNREPESDFAIDTQLELFPKVADLRQKFLESGEFQSTISSLRKRCAMRGDEPPLSVATGGDVEALFAHIAEVWEGFGDTEPHWSVLSSEGYTSDKIDTALDEFYETGQHAAKMFRHTLMRNGVDPAALASCLEYGCGVGRVTRWLAEDFDHVTGYDISAPHLAIAREWLEKEGKTNVSLEQVRTPGDLASLPKVDAVYTVIVLQHNPPPVMRSAIQGLLAALNPGGVAYFQLPTYIPGYRFDLDDYLSGVYTEDTMEMHLVPQHEVFELIDEAGCRVLEVLEDTWSGPDPNERSNTFVVQRRAG